MSGIQTTSEAGQHASKATPHAIPTADADFSREASEPRRREGSEPRWKAEHLERRRTVVAGRTATYSVGGDGPPIVFLHGWGVCHHVYEPPLHLLTATGRRVYLPAMPGFGGTAELPRDELSFAGYARWVDGFLGALGVEGPADIAGHSFGAAVGVQLAHDYPERVRRLALLNPVGAPAWQRQKTNGNRDSTARLLAGRPLWDWALALQTDILPWQPRIVPSILVDVVSNVVGNPLALMRAAELARTADLLEELATIGDSGLAILPVWSENDRVIPKASFDQLCETLGRQGVTVEGGHTWPLTRRQTFVDVMEDFFTPVSIAARLFGGRRAAL